jgi:hypothetical protein
MHIRAASPGAHNRYTQLRSSPKVVNRDILQDRHAKIATRSYGLLQQSGSAVAVHRTTDNAPMPNDIPVFNPQVLSRSINDYLDSN